jgi:hypothetical protein
MGMTDLSYAGYASHDRKTKKGTQNELSPLCLTVLIVI